MTISLYEKAHEIRQYLADYFGMNVDRYGHVKIETNSHKYRYKFQKQTIRLERLTNSGWVRLRTYNINDEYKALKSFGKTTMVPNAK